MDAVRQLVSDFLRLPYHAQRKVLIDLGLIVPDDLIMNDHNLYRKAFKKAKEEGKVQDLQDAIAEIKG
jgi:hypothetical protein